MMVCFHSNGVMPTTPPGSSNTDLIWVTMPSTSRIVSSGSIAMLPDTRLTARYIADRPSAVVSPTATPE